MIRTSRRLFGDSATGYVFTSPALPPLESGTTLSIEVQQTVSVPANSPSTQAVYTMTQQVNVLSARFQLDASLIDSMYPPPGGQGDYSTVLPHIVLSEPTLPWERLALPSPQPAPVNQTPWLALLVFDEGDAMPSVQSLFVSDLQTPGPGVFYPVFNMDGSQSTDPVSVIDIAADLFNVIAPTWQDAGWLAHTRTTPSGDSYAVLFANRLPVAGRQSTVHLVCLEDWGAYLPSDAQGSMLPSGTATVRLVTLANWSFSASGASQTFSDIAGALDLSRTGMQLPFTLNVPPLPSDPVVSTAFGLGYTAVNHSLRDGSSTVSWYRGPLLPLAVPTLDLPQAESADALVRYDPDTGMFDITYSAAWQLGQLLAMHDDAFGQALFRVKSALLQNAALAADRLQMETAIGRATVGKTPTGMSSSERTAHILRHLLAPALHEFQRRHGRVAASANAENPDIPMRAQEGSGEGPDSADLALILGWVTQLASLQGVPLSYLAPDLGMLPPESLRLFQLDTNWIAALVAGALSVGGPASQVIAAAVQQQLQTAGLCGAVSGFLVRSSLVQDWPGTVATAYVPDNGNDLLALPVIACTTLTPSLMLGLYAGTLTQLDLSQPSQTLFFGATVSGSAVTVSPRYAGNSTQYPAGSGTGGPPLPLTVRSTTLPGGSAPATTGSGTLAMQDFSGTLTPAIWPPDTTGTASSAEFALQFVQNSETVSFTPATAS